MFRTARRLVVANDWSDMSTNRALDLLQRVASDSDFRNKLESGSADERRTILITEGYEDVKLTHVSEVLHRSAHGELTDDEMNSVAGGGHTSTEASVSIGVWGAAAAVAGALF